MAFPQYRNHKIKDLTSPIEFLDDDHVICPKCKERIGLGPGGLLNLRDRHLPSKKCADTARSRDAGPLKKQMSLAGLLQPKSKPIPPTVFAPSLVNQAGTSSVFPSLPTVSPNPDPVRCDGRVEHEHTPLDDLEALLPGLDFAPTTATEPDLNYNCNLEAFNVDPALLDDPDVVTGDLWEEILNRIMHQAFWGKGDDELETMVRQEGTGLPGFCRFVRYFTERRGVDLNLFRERIDGLIRAIKSILPAYAQTSTPSHPIQSHAEQLPENSNTATHSDAEIIDVDAIEHGPTLGRDKNPVKVSATKSKSCEGYRLDIPEGESPHLLYPFALHKTLSLPWDYETCHGVFTLRSRACSRTPASTRSQSCDACLALTEDEKLRRIEERIKDGVHENSTLAYQGFGGIIDIVHRKDRQINALNLIHLNLERKLMGRAAALDDYKRLIWQIGNENYTNVERLIRVALGRGRGIRGILDMYEAAARGVYNPRSFTEEEEMLSVLFWRLGGIRLAEIAHRALNLPGMTTIRERSTVLLDKRERLTRSDQD